MVVGLGVQGTKNRNTLPNKFLEEKRRNQLWKKKSQNTIFFFLLFWKIIPETQTTVILNISCNKLHFYFLFKFFAIQITYYKLKGIQNSKIIIEIKKET